MLKKIKTPIFASAYFMLSMTILLGVIYPSSVYLIAKVTGNTADKQYIYDKDGGKLAINLIGQEFTQDKYLWGRLSYTASVPYNPQSSGGSNLSSNNPELIANAKKRIEALTVSDYENTSPIPADLVTGSASGLDPHITPAAAYYQAGRIAKARNMTVADIYKIIDKYTSESVFGIFGERTVHVVKVNLALDGKI